MVPVVGQLVPNSVVVCVKAEKQLGIKSICNRQGLKVFVTDNVRDCIKLCKQEMPHLILCDSILVDGDAGSVFDFLNSVEVLRSVPIIALAAEKTYRNLQFPINEKCTANSYQFRVINYFIVFLS